MSGKRPDGKQWAMLGSAAAIFAAAMVVAFRAGDPRAKVGLMLGEPVPASVRNVWFKTDAWMGLNPEPSYRLAFQVSTEDAALLIDRGKFLVEIGASLAGDMSDLLAPSGASNAIVAYRRAAKPSGCVVETLWWDSVSGTMWYHRACP